jgi:hypothetical protein
MNQPDPYKAPDSNLLDSRTPGSLSRGFLVALSLLTLLQVVWKAWYLPLYFQLFNQGVIEVGPAFLLTIFNLILVIGVILLWRRKKNNYWLLGAGCAMLLMCLFGRPMPITFMAQWFNWLGAGIGVLGWYWAKRELA